MKRRLVLPLLLAAACGEGAIGRPQGPDTGLVVIGGDSGVEADGGVIDDDGGVDMDAATPDVPCRARGEAPFPTEWPFAATKEAYVAEFWGGLPDRAATCSLEACHDINSIRPPLIPAQEAALDDPTTLATAMRELWDRARPQLFDGVDTPTSKLLYNHRMNGGVAPTFRAPQATYLQAFVARGQQCGWLPIARAEQTSGPRCDDAGVCDCAIDVSALGYCRDIPDGGN